MHHSNWLSVCHILRARAHNFSILLTFLPCTRGIGPPKLERKHRVSRQKINFIVRHTDMILSSRNEFDPHQRNETFGIEQSRHMFIQIRQLRKNFYGFSFESLVKVNHINFIERSIFGFYLVAVICLRYKTIRIQWKRKKKSNQSNFYVDDFVP